MPLLLKLNRVLCSRRNCRSIHKRAGWLEAKTGQAVVPGDVNGSLLIQAVRDANQDLQMPPDEQLDAESICLLGAVDCRWCTWTET